MKKLLFVRAAVAVFVLCFTYSACSNIDVETQTKDDFQPEHVEEGDLQVTFNCSMDNSESTKTEFHDKTVWWSEGDSIRFYQRYLKAGSTTYSVGYADRRLSQSQESFTTTISFTSPAEYPAYYWSLYPSASVVSSLATLKGKEGYFTCMRIPAEQNPSLNSFDPKADVLVSEFIQSNQKMTSFSLRFRRVVALGKMTIKNLPSENDIKSVKIDCPRTCAADSYFGLDSAVFSGIKAGTSSSSIVMNYSEPVTASSSTGMTAYFTCLAFAIAEGESFTVTVTTANGEVFTRNVTVPAGREIKFEEGKGTKFSVDMSTAEKTSEWFTLGASSRVNTIDTVYCRISKNPDFSGEFTSVKYKVVSKNSYNPNVNYIDSTASSLSNISSFNNGGAFIISLSGCAIGKEYVFIAECETSDGKTCRLTRTERADWFKFAAHTSATKGGRIIASLFSSSDVASIDYKVFASEDMTGIDTSMYESIFNAASDRVSLSSTQINSIVAKGNGGYGLGIQCPSPSTEYVVMVKAVKTDGSARFVYDTASSSALD